MYVDHTGRGRAVEEKRAESRMRRHGISLDRLSRAPGMGDAFGTMHDGLSSEQVKPRPRRWSVEVLRLLGPVGFVALLLIAWHIAVKSQKAAILPGPLAVGSGLVELARRGLLLKYVVASLYRVTWGFVAAASLGIPLGL